MTLVEFQEVTYSYPRGSHRKPFSFGPMTAQLSRGTITGLAGHNGIGKSTSLLLFAGLVKPASGVVKRHSLNLRFGLCFQNATRSLLPWKSVARNVAFGARDGNNPITDVLDEAAVPREAFPYQLSGGQQQLVNLVRAFGMGEDVVLLDEPFSSLDFDNTLAVCRKMFALRSGLDRAVALVAHSLDFQLALCDSVAILGGNPTRVIGHVKGIPATSGAATFDEALPQAEQLAKKVRNEFDDHI